MRLIDLGHGIRMNAFHWGQDLEDLFAAQGGALAKNLSILHRQFEGDRQNFLIERAERTSAFDRGDFSALKKTLGKNPVQGDWKIQASGRLKPRRAEVLAPAGDEKVWRAFLEAKSLPSTLVFDLEDSIRPTWKNITTGHLAIRAHVQELIDSLPISQMPIVAIRPRGLHLKEINALVDGAPMSAALFDLCTAMASLNSFQGQLGTIHFYLPKIETPAEARWFSQVIEVLRKLYDLPPASLRVSVLIETVLAGVFMEEILYELKNVADALILGRWDYIFNAIKIYRNQANHLFMGREHLNSAQCPWLENFSKRVVQVAHRHGALAIGAMSTEVKSLDETIRAQQVEGVYQTKHQEARLGLDGAWVADPYFTSAVLEAFPLNHSLDQTWPELDSHISILPAPGKVSLSEESIRSNIAVVIAYQLGFEKGYGRIEGQSLVEDLCTFEISRTQLWHWLKHQAPMAGGSRLDKLKLGELFEKEFAEAKTKLLSQSGGEQALDSQRAVSDLRKAMVTVREFIMQDELVDFLELDSDPYRAFPLD